jgi:hypothetical protein
LVHGSLTASNILFDSDHCVQIVDFQPIGLVVCESESEGEEVTILAGFSGQRWIPQMDISRFASILFEIVVGRPANGETSVPTNIPDFVAKIIETGLWSERRCSFHDILEILKKNSFQIELCQLTSPPPPALGIGNALLQDIFCQALTCFIGISQILSIDFGAVSPTSCSIARELQDFSKFIGLKHILNTAHDVQDGHDVHLLDRQEVCCRLRARSS